MKPSTALLLFTLVDLFAIVTFYFLAYQPLNQAILAIANQADFIRYNTTFYIAFGVFFLPVVHIVGLVETYWPSYFNRSICTKLIYSTLILSIMLGVGTSVWLRHKILYNGYTHCESADIHRKLLQIRVYVLNEEACHRLTMEKESSRRLGLR